MHRIVTGDRARWLVVGAVAVLLLAACGGDDDDSSTGKAKPITVSLLAGLNDQRDPNIVVTEFLPEAVTVVAGSTLEWRFAGIEPHSVTFLPAGQVPPRPGTDAALARPTTPLPTTFDGTSTANSGLLPVGTTPASPFRLTFPTAGQFSYVCVIHPLMSGTVTVAAEGAAVDAVDSQSDINERADGELNKWLDEGQAAKKVLTDAAPKQVEGPDGPDGPIAWTYGMGITTEHADVVAFAPANGEVRPGDSVTFVNNTLAPHTATFKGEGQVPQNPDDPAVTAASGPSPLTLLPTGGPYNTGVLPPASPPDPPPEAARTFTFVIPEAGSYDFVCVYHAASGMKGTIKVA